MDGPVHRLHDRQARHGRRVPHGPRLRRKPLRADARDRAGRPHETRDGLRDGLRRDVDGLDILTVLNGISLATSDDEQTARLIDLVLGGLRHA
ncbi:hypothetical protein [Kutzneria kofuensis]|uniref:hypothetical protein n=1 Tax=Kutzneria kofuensis TaxID=103725 RepID=UPI0031E5BDC8